MDSAVGQENAKTMEMNTYHGTCKEIDNLLLKLFSLMDALMEERNEMNNLMKYAYVDMAKARYSLGNARVSSLQFSMEEISALKHVIARKESNDGYSFISYLVIDSKITGKNENNTTINENYMRKKILNNENNEIDQLIEKTSELEMKEEKIKKESKDTKKSHEKIQDPLKWFGVLVPQSLKNCQKYFQQNIDRIVTIASIQNEIKSILDKIEYLQTEKIKMKSNKT
ncbi:coiled-coil domain-containing protein 115-like [Centruroides vittatus]|uniref:coiled-coil domain-containing protein 115-like n=1 Tax=Centruroides vittatus TaxID=120091 RepID=UPI00350F7368